MRFHVKSMVPVERLRARCLCALIAYVCLINLANAQTKFEPGDAWNTGSVFAAGTQCEMKGYMAQDQTMPLLARILQKVPLAYAQAINHGYQEGLKRTAIYSKNYGRWFAYSKTPKSCSKIQYAIRQYKLTYETIKRGADSSRYLEGPARSSFIAGTVEGCMRNYGSGRTSIIPKPLIEEYCQCYANGLADRAKAQDIKSENRAVMDPIVKEESARCYATIKQKALQNYLQKR